MDNLLELVGDCTVLKFTDNKEAEKLEEVIKLRSLGFKKIADDMENELQHKVKLKRISELGYIEITDEAIKKFLKRKAENYNKKHQKDDRVEPRITRSNLMDVFNSMLPRGSALEGHWEIPVIEPYRELLARQMAQMTHSDYHAPYGLTFGQSIADDWYGIPNSARAKNATFSEKTCDFYSSEEGKIGQYLWTELKIEDYKTIPPKEILERLKEEQNKNVFDYFTIASVEGIKDPVLLGKINNYNGRFFISQWGTDVTLDDLVDHGR